MLDEKNITYDEANLPPLINVQVRSGFSETADYKLYEKLCQGKPPPPEVWKPDYHVDTVYLSDGKGLESQQ